MIRNKTFRQQQARILDEAATKVGAWHTTHTPNPYALRRTSNELHNSRLDQNCLMMQMHDWLKDRAQLIREGKKQGLYD
jgi:hypothetical protein